MGEEEKEPQVMICPTCGEEKLCYWDTDPYASEINDDNTLMWQCGDCAYQSAMDI